MIINFSCTFHLNPMILSVNLVLFLYLYHQLMLAWWPLSQMLHVWWECSTFPETVLSTRWAKLKRSVCLPEVLLSVQVPCGNIYRRSSADISFTCSSCVGLSVQVTSSRDIWWPVQSKKDMILPARQADAQPAPPPSLGRNRAAVVFLFLKQKKFSSFHLPRKKAIFCFSVAIFIRPEALIDLFVRYVATLRYRDWLWKQSNCLWQLILSRD